MSLRIGDEAPNFTAETTEGKVNFHEWVGDKWCVLMSHPKDFTPVCTTELGFVAKTKAEFEKRNCKVIAVSVDDVKSHKGWIGDIEETQRTTMNFPIIGDPERKVASLYGMIHPNASDTLTVRSVFFLDPRKKVHVEAEVAPGRAEIIVEDEGPGFSRDTVPDPTADENLCRPSGRGILLIESYMSDVSWERGGRRLRMIKQAEND